jgi:predicted Fe-Mo cluster-binding NifX family protein
VKVAVTSTNGTNIDMHFGKAGYFYIYELIQGQVHFLGKRAAECYCTGSRKMHQFTPSRLTGIVEQLKDCSLLITSRIGATPKRHLNGFHISVKECSGLIEPILFSISEFEQSA